ncbi:hypothetical protein D3C72_2134630 [compost metagenome]
MREHELTLDEMLDDPIVRLLMARDGVNEDELRDLAAQTRGRRRPGLGEGAGPIPSEGRAFADRERPPERAARYFKISKRGAGPSL